MACLAGPTQAPNRSTAFRTHARSSILTPPRQTNAFGHVLEEKLVAEKYLRASGLDWTIVRPGGLQADPPTGALFVSGENTLNSGEISRDLVADVSVAALFDPKASNQVVEIVESDKDGNAKTGIFNGLKM